MHNRPDHGLHCRHDIVTSSERHFQIELLSSQPQCLLVTSLTCNQPV
jgi:hypothetical protein